MSYYITTLITTELLHSFLMYNTYYFIICSNCSNIYTYTLIRKQYNSQYKGIYHGGLLLHLLNVLRNALYPSSLRKENVVVRGYVYSKNADYPYSREILQEGYVPENTYNAPFLNVVIANGEVVK
ncbi:MAG: hypothetical protein QXU98_14505 [Candidatus Parvarchaeota archaeon]